MIEYVNVVAWYLPTFETNDPKVITNLDEFPSILKSMVQCHLVQVLDSNLHLY